MTKKLITLDCEQGTQEWLVARLGIPTATGIKNIVNPSGQKSAGWIPYLAELVAESIEGVTESFKSQSMERGNELEPLARMAYEFETGTHLLQYANVGTFWEHSQINISGLVAENEILDNNPEKKKAVSY